MNDHDRPTFLRWQLLSDRAELLRADERLLEIHHAPSGGLWFTWNGAEHVLRRSGFWKPRTRIERNGQEILASRGSGVGGGEVIELSDGSRYTSKWSNAPLARLAYRDARGEEVLSLRLIAEEGLRTETILASGVELDAKVILLLALAYHQFNGAMRGNGGEDLLLLLAAGV